MARVALVVLSALILLPHCASDANDPEPAVQQTPTPPLEGWKPTFSDEFNGASGAPIDATKWTAIRQGDGFGNGELEFYTDRLENVALDGQGFLNITVRREPYENREYTSARLETLSKFEQRYGRFEARIKLPRGQGLWPAFWMMGNDVVQVSWPACGEIDIMESVGHEPTIIHGNLQGPGYSGDQPLRTNYSLPTNAAFADDFHVFAVEWEENVVRFYVDNVLYVTRTPLDVPAGGRWVYDHPFYLLLNVAVGGTFPGPPDATTVFPQVMQVDYVRVYQR